MLFYAVDIAKYPKTNFWHVIYKLKKDEKCPYVTLRIVAKRADFTHQHLTIQILEFINGGKAHDRNIVLSKIKVIAEGVVMIPTRAKSSLMFN